MKPLFTTLFFFLCFALFAQDDMLSLLGEEKVANLSTAAFKTNRVINGHSIENTAKGVMDFKINHRFGPLNGGAYELFGIDQAFVRFGFDYGITDRLMVGVGRNSYEKVYDGFVKYKIFRQQSGLKNVPVSVSYLANMDFKTTRWNNVAFEGKPWLRAYYTHQLLIARKLSSWTTVQIMPTLVHRNLVATKLEKNNVFLVGVAARQKITKRLAVNAEYTYAFPNQLALDIVPTLSLGVDIETGGHVFQLMFTNSNGTDHRSFLTEANQKWLDRGMRFGFNVSRVFTIVKPKEL
ncbi:MAG: DUF5777 family beta-barrel protein [Saprospiraceae bacterium]